MTQITLFICMTCGKQERYVDEVIETEPEEVYCTFCHNKMTAYEEDGVTEKVYGKKAAEENK